MGTPPESLLTWPLSLDGYSSNELSSSLHFFFFFLPELTIVFQWALVA